MIFIPQQLTTHFACTPAPPPRPVIWFKNLMQTKKYYTRVLSWTPGFYIFGERAQRTPLINWMMVLLWFTTRYMKGHKTSAHHTYN